MRFILVSFAFMGWAFYELSGGAEFDPEAFKAEQIAAYQAEKGVEEVAEPKPEPRRVVVDPAPQVTVADTSIRDAEVTRVALNLTSLQTVVDRTDETAADGTGITPTEETPVPQNASLVTSSADTPAIIPSLIDPNDGVTTSAILSDNRPLNIRTVAGNRVNVRGGPGTNFGVVGGLVRGDEIRVLEEDGTGWVRFETMDGITAGWMAEFLLVDG